MAIRTVAEKILKYFSLKAKGSSLKCVLCDSRSFTIPDEGNPVSFSPAASGSVASGKEKEALTHPCYLVICDQCSHVLFFSAPEVDRFLADHGDMAGDKAFMRLEDQK